jgi:transcriptional regulator with XRE-family HTH domain
MDHALPPRPPPPDTIAGFVKLQRAMYGWKRETLAGLAKVSLSTVERVERGEAVRASSLEKLALALNQRADAFTAARVPLSEAEALALLAENISWMEGLVPVAVAPFASEAQLRALTDTDVLLVTSDLGDDAEEEVALLREWLDLTGFCRAEDGSFLPKRERSFSIRRLYKDVLDAVAGLERQHKAVCLVGTYEARSSTAEFDTLRVAVLAVRSRERNPACGKITQLLGEGAVDMRAAWQNYFKGID